MPASEKCECGRPVVVRGLCRPCYLRAWRARQPASYRKRLAAYHKKWNDEHRPPRKPVVTKTCQRKRCGKQFKTNRADKVYCSAACQKRNYYVQLRRQRRTQATGGKR